MGVLFVLVHCSCCYHSVSLANSWKFRHQLWQQFQTFWAIIMRSGHKLLNDWRLECHADQNGAKRRTCCGEQQMSSERTRNRPKMLGFVRRPWKKHQISTKRKRSWAWCKAKKRHKANSSPQQWKRWKSLSHALWCHKQTLRKSGAKQQLQRARFHINDGKTCFVERFVSEGRSESGSADEMSDQSALEESGLDEPDVDVWSNCKETGTLSHEQKSTEAPKRTMNLEQLKKWCLWIPSRTVPSFCRACTMLCVGGLRTWSEPIERTSRVCNRNSKKQDFSVHLNSFLMPFASSDVMWGGHSDEPMNVAICRHREYTFFWNIVEHLKILGAIWGNNEWNRVVQHFKHLPQTSFSLRHLQLQWYRWCLCSGWQAVWCLACFHTQVWPG